MIFFRRPRVSVCLPLYNTAPDLLRNCIASVLNQTFDNFEFLILNDSPDNTELDKIVREFKDRRIKYRKNKKNLGISESRNKLLKWSRGEYIAVCDHDDVSLPTRFERAVEFLDNNYNFGAVSSDYIISTPAGKDFFTYTYHDNIGIKGTFAYDSSFMHPAAMIRKSVLDKHGIKYEPEFSPAEDCRLWARLAEFTQFHILPEYLVEYWVGTENTTFIQQQRMCQCLEEIRFQFKNKFPYLSLGVQLDALNERVAALESKLNS